MVRKNIFLSDKQIQFLEENKDLNLSDHLRRALDMYIENLKAIKASGSQSKLNKW